MKNRNMLMMLVAGVLLSSCLSDDANDLYSNFNNWANGGTSGSATVTTASGELSDFDVAIDKATAEPATVADAIYFDESDNISTQQFTTQVAIDMSNPTEKTENGVTITVTDGKYVTADHGKTTGICYVVSGTTADGSLTISGSADYEVNLNNANITSSQSTALNLDGKGAAYIVLAGTNKLNDGTAEDHKSALYGKGKMLFSGSGSLEIQGQYNNGIQSKSYVLFEKVLTYMSRLPTTASRALTLSSTVVSSMWRRQDWVPRASTATRTSLSMADVLLLLPLVMASGTKRNWRPRPCRASSVTAC